MTTQSIEQFVNDHLNEPQQQAVRQQSGALLIVAGAGSGKTRVITSRIAYLIQKYEVNPSSIVALTFTNKAAGEMKERIAHFLAADQTSPQGLPFVGTFHAYCLNLLRRYPQLTDNQPFSIIDSDDQEQMIHRMLKHHGLEKRVSAATMLHAISQAKNNPETAATPFTLPYFKELQAAYAAEKKRSRLLDFDDLILTVLNALETDHAFAETLQTKVQHLLVDEYQDTNAAQHKLLQRIAKNASGTCTITSFCAVGDEDQSIYSWRGAVVTNMQQFKNDFAPVSVIKIEQNYRSVEPILQAANKVIAHNKVRTPKNLWSSRSARNRILMMMAESGYQEADAVALLIQCMPTAISRSSIAILYRTHFQSRAIEEAMLRHGITYTIVGGIRFYERKEIKDILAYLRLVVNPFDRASFFRIINCPTRGLGTKFEEYIDRLWNQSPAKDFKDILRQAHAETDGELSNAHKEGIIEFLEIFDELQSEQPASHIVPTMLARTRYREYLRQTLEGEELITKIENIRELEQSIRTFESQGSTVAPSVVDFLNEVALMQERLADLENKSSAINMMTLHAAKGLEFDTVIITGLEEGVLPSSRSLNNHAALEEERRLLYVGMTRAQERLILSRARFRSTYGQTTGQIVSRFVAEVPQEITKELDLSELHPTQLRRFFAEWTGNRVMPSALTTFGERPKTELSRPSLAHRMTTKTTTVQSTTTEWRRNQTVMHPTFGMGVVMLVEQKSADEWYLTIRFQAGEKKLLSSFVRRHR